jgi:hypothetical protein
MSITCLIQDKETGIFIHAAIINMHGLVVVQAEPSDSGVRPDTAEWPSAWHRMLPSSPADDSVMATCH